MSRNDHCIEMYSLVGMVRALSNGSTRRTGRAPGPAIIQWPAIPWQVVKCGTESIEHYSVDQFSQLPLATDAVSARSLSRSLSRIGLDRSATIFGNISARPPIEAHCRRFEAEENPSPPTPVGSTACIRWCVWR